MKVIDLLNKIANGEEVPKRIIYDQFVYVWNSKIENYQREVDEITTLNWDYITINCLNEPVEILEEKEICHKCHKYPAEYNQTYCEFCLDISKLKEKKIPEKLFFTHISNYNDQSVVNNNFNNYFKKTGEAINEIIDYLKSKGE